MFTVLTLLYNVARRYAEYLRVYVANHTSIPRRSDNTTTPSLLITPDTLEDFGDFRLCDEARGDVGTSRTFVCDPEILGRYVLIFKYNNTQEASLLGALILCEVVVYGHLYSSEFSSTIGITLESSHFSVKRNIAK